VEATHDASSHEDSPDDPSQSTGTDGLKAIASQNISQSQGAVQPDPEHRQGLAGLDSQTKASASRNRKTSGTSASAPGSEKRNLVHNVYIRLHTLNDRKMDKRDAVHP